MYRINQGAVSFSCLLAQLPRDIHRDTQHADALCEWYLILAAAAREKERARRYFLYAFLSVQNLYQRQLAEEWKRDVARDVVHATLFHQGAAVLFATSVVRLPAPFIAPPGITSFRQRISQHRHPFALLV